MNLVLHNALARRDLASGLGAVGAMLPDLWRMADRRARPARVPGDVASDDARVAALLAGIAHHTRIDAVFHRSDVFTRGEREMRAALAQVTLPRLTLFAHVAWEMCLDGALVMRRGGALLDEIRADAADATSGDALAQAARLHHAARDRAVPAGLDARVARLLTELARGSFVLGYAEVGSLAERLDAIRRRLGFPPLVTGERAAVASALEPRLAGAADALDEVLALAA